MKLTSNILHPETPGTRARREWNHRDRDKPENLARELNATAEHLEDMAIVHTDRGNAAAARDAASRAAAIRRQARRLT